MNPAVVVIRQWHHALNAGDYEKLITLADQNVEMHGSRGTTNGLHQMREWLYRANVRFFPLRSFSRGNRMVIEERGEWLDGTTGEVAGSQTVAILFEVTGERISKILRYDDLQEAMQIAGLTTADEVQLDEGYTG